jgi:hypothetical protein
VSSVLIFGGGLRLKSLVTPGNSRHGIGRWKRDLMIGDLKGDADDKVVCRSRE